MRILDKYNRPFKAVYIGEQRDLSGYSLVPYKEYEITIRKAKYGVTVDVWFAADKRTLAYGGLYGVLRNWDSWWWRQWMA